MKTRKPSNKTIMRKFNVTLNVEISIDQRLLDSVLNDEWRRSYYDLFDPEQVAAWLAYNYARGSTVETIDGVADQPGSSVVFKWTGDDDATEVPAASQKPKRRKVR